MVVPFFAFLTFFARCRPRILLLRLVQLARAKIIMSSLNTKSSTRPAAFPTPVSAPSSENSPLLHLSLPESPCWLILADGELRKGVGKPQSPPPPSRFS